jgi:hypothetical protein
MVFPCNNAIILKSSAALNETNEIASDAVDRRNMNVDTMNIDQWIFVLNPHPSSSQISHRTPWTNDAKYNP